MNMLYPKNVRWKKFFQEVNIFRRFRNIIPLGKEWIIMSIVKTIHPQESTHIPEPPIAKFLFADTRMAWFWLIVRLYVGYQWLTAGLEKLTGHDFTIGSSFGQATKGGAWIFGVLTGIAAFFGVFMNLNFMLAGAVSINPIIGMLALLLVLAWRVAGYYGVDSYLLPLLGTPWTGRLTHKVVPKAAAVTS